tara:strand:+ start:534 stop:800 length:267 start_codon:yes stop_codon:yes gene_type:complete
MESKNILQVLINLKQIVEVSQSRGCWKAEEMKDIGLTYNNVSEVVKQLQAEQTQEEETHEPIETIVEQVKDNHEPKKEEIKEEMEEID